MTSPNCWRRWWKNSWLSDKTDCRCIQTKGSAKFAADRPQYRDVGLPGTLASGAWVLTGIDHSAEWLGTAAIYT